VSLNHLFLQDEGLFFLSYNSPCGIKFLFGFYFESVVVGKVEYTSIRPQSEPFRLRGEVLSVSVEPVPLLSKCGRFPGLRPRLEDSVLNTLAIAIKRRNNAGESSARKQRPSAVPSQFAGGVKIQASKSSKDNGVPAATVLAKAFPRIKPMEPGGNPVAGRR
jgi:hypothetical protein